MMYHEDMSFKSLFEVTVGKNLTKIAAVYDDKSITYQVLNSHANQLSKKLLELGVETNDIVAIYMDRSILFLTSVIATFKLGAAYMPIDISQPDKRKSQIIEQSRVKYIITDSATRPFLDKLFDSLELKERMIIIEISEECFRLELEENIEFTYNPSGTAYVMFTSGSTGQPKGVMVKHNGMVNHLLSKINDMNISGTDIMVESASQCFDISVWQFLSCLIVGGQVHILNNKIAGNPEDYLSYVDNNHVTIFQVVPSMLKSMISYLNTSKKKYKMEALRWIALVGEALPPYVCRQWFSFYPNVPMLNSYGPTECSDGVSHYIVEIPPDKEVINMPIGKPIDNLEVYVTNISSDKLELASPEEEGELCVAGVGVGRGYLYDEEKTSMVFQDNPFSDKEGYETIYKTGDLVKYLPSGDLEYLGRIDRQVKLRGFRIELGEIESVLAEHERVKSCTVVTSNMVANQQKLVARKGIVSNEQEEKPVQLIAYVIEDDHVSDNDYRKYLGEKLPHYMVPERYVRVESFPVNSNGKLNVKMLPNPSHIRPDIEYDFVEPRTAGEKMLSHLWSDVLVMDKVGRNDYFFDLGGDSLLAMKIINRIYEKFMCQVTFQDIFNNRLQELSSLILTKQTQGVAKDGMEEVSLDKTYYPLTLQQKQLWFLWKMYPQSPFYTLQGELTITGTINPQAFLEALRFIMKENDLLRANIKEMDGNPYLKVNEISDIQLEIQDISNENEEKKQQIIQEYAKNQVSHVFDLANDSLLRYKMFCISENKSILLMTTHEIVFDAWSLSTFIRELNSVYGDIMHKKTAALQGNKMQFRTYTLWEEKNITRENLSKEKAYWKDKLSDCDSYLNLPRVKSGMDEDHQGGTKVKLLSKELSDHLRGISRETGATLFMTILAAFNILLSKYTGQNDIVIGTPHVNRNNPGTENIYGFFLNMLPIRTKLDKKMTFHDVLNVVKESAYGAIENSAYPFMWICEDLRKTEQFSNSPLFQVMFNMYSEKYEGGKLNDEFAINFREIETGYTKYDMSLYAQENGEQIYLQLSYLKNMFSDVMMERMIDNFQVLLNCLTTNPQCPIMDVEYISEVEKQKLIYDLNQTDAPYDKTNSITQLFEKCVLENSQSVALICENKKMSYEELNNRANCLAKELAEMGVKKNSIVGLCISRSFNTVVSIMAVLKLGAVYVALDQNYPELRLKDIIMDSNMELLVEDEHSLDFDFYMGKRLKIQQIDYSKYCENPVYQRPDNNLMNMVYTSSSTGKPKGVLMTMDSVLNRLYWMWNAYPFMSNDVAVLQKSSALVAASWELFGGLCKNIPTVILTQEDITKPKQLWRQLVNHKVSYLLSSPSFIRIVLEEAKHAKEKWASLRLATTSAEPISKALVKQWYDTFPEVHLLNLYGSTECSSNAAAYDTRLLCSNHDSVPIGRPLSNVRLFILDEDKHLLPYGVKGELCIWGDCVSSGYLNLPQLTKDHYIEDIFYGDTSKHIFCSGDNAFYLEDGNIELVGRKDFQVKIRGYRVELAEIELALLNNTFIHSAVALVEEDKNIVSYIVLKEENKIDEVELKKYSREFLPEYMIPTEFRIVDKMPLTNAGKIDRNALKQSNYALLRSNINTNEYDDVELKIKDIFVDILETQDIDKNIDFFDMGGNSLLAVRVANELEKIFHKEILISSFMRNSSINSLAQQIKFC